MNFIYQHMRESLAREMIENRESCKHWLNYEVLDALPENLKETYIEQFPIPNFCFNPVTMNKRMECRANHKDDLGVFRCDCSEHYQITLEKTFLKFGFKLKEDPEGETK